MTEDNIALGPAGRFGYKQRPSRFCNLERLLTTMEARGLDGILSYYSRNVLYLSGYASGATSVYGEANGFTAFVISRHQPDHPIVIVPDLEIGYFLRQPTWVRDVQPYRSVILPVDIPWEPGMIDRFIPKDAHEIPWVQRAKDKYCEDLTQACVRALRDLGLDKGRVGCDNLSFAPMVASHLPDVEITDAYGMMKFVRMIKTGPEQSMLEEASLLNQEAIERTVKSWTPGMSWRDLNMTYAVEAVRLGGFVLDRGSLVLANPRGADTPMHQLSTGLEDDFTLESGMHLMFDCHGRYNNYNWDGGKTWVVGGQVNDYDEKIARACGDAMEEVLSSARPGVHLSQVQARGRRVLEAHNVPDSDSALIYFHGLGLDNSEQEWGTPLDWTMETGMVLAAHIYYHGDERRRYYIEEIGVVTPDGHRTVLHLGYEGAAGGIAGTVS